MGKRSTQMELEKRRETITDMLMTGARPSQICTHLKISHTTFGRDMSEIRKRMKDDVSGKTPTQIFGELMVRMNMRTRRLWNIITNGESTQKDIIAAVNALRDEDRELVRNCQILGILPAIAENQVNIQNNSMEHINVYQMVMDIKKAQAQADKELAAKKVVT